VWSRFPVLEAANRKAVCLIVGIPVDRRVARIQVAFPGISARLKRGPQVRVRAAIVEGTRGIPVAGKKSARRKK